MANSRKNLETGNSTDLTDRPLSKDAETMTTEAETAVSPDSTKAGTSEHAKAGATNHAKAKTKNRAKAKTTDLAKAETPDLAKAETTNRAKVETSDLAKVETSDLAKAKTTNRAKAETPDLAKSETPDLAKAKKTNHVKAKKTNHAKAKKTDRSASAVAKSAACPVIPQTENEVDRELRRFDVKVYQGDNAHKKIWNSIEKDEKAASMIRMLCYDKKKKEQSVILISPDHEEKGKLAYGMFSLSVKDDLRTVEKKVFAKRVPCEKVEELVKEEYDAPRKLLLAKEELYCKQLKKEKISKSLEIALNSTAILFFLVFLCLTLLFKLYGFDGTQFKTVLANELGEHFLDSFALIFAIAACNFIGFLAFYDFPLPDFINYWIPLLAYIAALSSVLYFGWTIPLKQVYGGDVETWIRSSMGIFWIAAVIFSVISFAGYIVIRKLHLSDKLFSLFYIFITILFPFVFLGLCLMVAGKLLDIIDERMNRGGSSGSSSKTYEFTNSAGCITTVKSDNGRDFYDTASGSYVGSSSDGGKTITKK